MSKSRRTSKREKIRLRKPVSLRPGKVEIPKTAYDRKMSTAVDTDDEYDPSLSDSLDYIEDAYSVGSITKERIKGLLKIVLSTQPIDKDQYDKRERAIERLANLIVR